MNNKQQINRWMRYVHLVFLLFLGLQGNVFIKFKLLIPSVFLVLYFVFCSAHVLYFTWMNRKTLRLRNLNILEKVSLLFVAVYLLYGGLSWFGVFDQSAVDGIQFSRGYVLRHMVMIGFLPIGLSMYILALDPQTEKAIFKSRLPVVMLVFMAMLLGYFRNTEGYFLVLLLLFTEYSAADKRWKKLIPALMMLVCLLLRSGKGTATFLFFSCVLVMITGETLFRMLSKYKVLLGLAALAAMAMVLVFYDQILGWLRMNDVNTWWRFYFWKEEVKAVAARGFTGVGFGTAYAAISIRETLRGGFVDPVAQELVKPQGALYTIVESNPYLKRIYQVGLLGFTLFEFVNFGQIIHGTGNPSLAGALKSTYDAFARSVLNQIDTGLLFTTAQHNSYVNIFYRTGIIGLALFVFVNFGILTQGKGKTGFERLLMLAFINGSILILFNVGLESPRFLILFYLGFFGALGLYRRGRNPQELATASKGD